MSVDLGKGARPDEVPHFYTQRFPPVVKSHFDWGIIRRTSWGHVINQDGATGRFVSWWLFGKLQLYHGTAKCDASRTYMLHSGQLGEPFTDQDYVMTSHPKELWALRWRKDGPGNPEWRGMGGS